MRRWRNSFFKGELCRLSLSGDFFLVMLLAANLAVISGCRHQGEYYGKTEPPSGNVFRFNNGAEPEYLDPALMVGQPDHRIAGLLFEGLTNTDPKTLEQIPGVAERWEISPDGLTYMFYLRDNAKWSDGRPITAEDFVYSWTRVLTPQTASRYASQLYYLVNGELFNQGRITDASLLGVRALDDYTLEIHLQQPTSYFLFLTSFFTLFPVPSHVVEKHGARWTEPENIVGNGPFLLEEHQSHARFEFIPNPHYWNREKVRLDRIIAYSVDDNYTSANMYEAGMVDWLPGNFPAEYVPHLKSFRDFASSPFLANYYYSFNVTKPPLDNPLVRRALSLAVNRRAITDDLLRGGQIPGAHFVPLGFPNYQSPPAEEYNPEEAARLLAEAGYPGGQGFPEIEILFNTLESHRKIAESIQQMWINNLNIHVTLRNEEWASYLKSLTNLEYQIARQGWVADYPNPTTFLDLMESTNGNNHTGWNNSEFDRLIMMARQETDADKQMEILQRSEALLMNQAPVIPIYTSSSNSLFKPYVRGLFPNSLDLYPLNEVWIDQQWSRNKPLGGAVR